jgi:hypothetical protein
MTFVTLSDVKLYLNKEDLAAAETALVERLEQLVCGYISAYCDVDPFAGPFTAAANRACLEYVLLTLIAENFYRITRESIGWTHGKFGNIEITLTDEKDINAVCLHILQAFRQTSFCA